MILSESDVSAVFDDHFLGEQLLSNRSGSGAEGRDDLPTPHRSFEDNHSFAAVKSLRFRIRSFAEKFCCLASICEWFERCVAQCSQQDGSCLVYLLAIGFQRGRRMGPRSSIDVL